MRRVLIFCAFLAGGCTGESAKDAGPITSTPLPQRTPADGPRFRRVDPKVSGLDFTNVLRKENNVPYIYTGAGVAVGDYDGDGLPDVYLVCQDGPNKLFKQVAPMRFVDVTESAGGLGGGDAWGTAATFVDINGDGLLDLYVCNLESPNLLYLNQGNGTFRECAAQFGLAICAASTGACFADYDNDGDLDLFLVTNRMLGPVLPQEIVDEVTLPATVQKTKEQLFQPAPKFETRDGKRVLAKESEDFFYMVGGQVFAAGQQDRLYRNDGYAKWTDVTAQAGISGHGNGLSAVWWDYDGDGWLDLYVANDLDTPDQLWHNRGNGTFEDVTRTALSHVAWYGMGCDFGDLDNDGRLDFCVADMSSTTHYMAKLLMGNMGDKRWFLMNADPQQYMRNAVFVNTGTGRFLEAAYLTGLASTDWTWTVRFADLDEDGRLDFFATNGIPWFEDHPDKIAEIKRLQRAGRSAQALDIVRSLARVEEKHVARRNLGDLRFQDVGAEWGLDEANVSMGAVIADFDRDGDLDILVNNQNSPASLFENRSADSHRIEVQLRGTTSNKFGIGSRITLQAGGLTQTRLLMLARGYMSAGEPVEHFGLGKNETIDKMTVRWPSGIEQSFEHLAVDRFYTIREPAAAQKPTPAPQPVPVWFGDVDLGLPRHQERDFDDYALQPLLPHRLSRLGPGIACGDVDGDGLDDLWIGGAAGQGGSLLLARDGGRFERVPGPWEQDKECEDLGALLFDADGDGDLDLYVVSGSIECGAKTERLRDRLYLNDGHGRFVRAPADALPDLRESGSVVCAADIDHDGDLDLFVGGRTIPGRYPEAPPSRILRNVGGRFIDVTAEVAPELLTAGMVTGAVFTDLDGDGFADLVVVAQWQPVRVFHNEAGREFTEITRELGLGSLLGQWNSVIAADLDNDGDMDLVVANVGLNTKYKADREHPMHLFAADFDGNGVLDIIECKQQGDLLLPVRGRSCSSEAMPFLKERFPTFDSFARASLPEIYGKEQLDKALELTANELQHVVLENQGTRFVVHPLPRPAQVAPGYGLVAADFDGDGVLDLAMAQNSFSPEPETGRFDGGIGAVLRGKGKLEYEAVPADRSGMVMPEDGKAMIAIDLDGDGAPDLVASTNNGPVRAFRSAPRAGALCVRLRGGKGNPTAIGARVQLLHPDGTRQMREIQAGAGYLSQSAPCAFFAKVPAGSRLQIHWPDGSSSEHAIEPAAGTMKVSQ